MSFSFRTIELVLAIKNNKSLSKAAKILYVSEPALSKQISRMEKELGFSLVQRRNNGCSLTKAGEILAENGEKLLKERDEILKEMEKAAAPRSIARPLRLGSANCYVESILPGVLFQYMKQFPETKVELLENRTDILEQMCVEGSVDLILTQMEPANSQLEYMPVMTEETVLYVPAGYEKIHSLGQAVKEGSILLNQLKDYPYAQLQGHLRFQSFIEPLFRERDFSPRTVFQSESWTAVLDLIRQGVCYTMIPMIFQVPNEQVKILRIKSSLPTTRTLALAYKAGTRLPAQWQEFIRLARQHLSGQPLLF